MAVDVKDVFQLGPCGPDCAVLELANVLSEKLGVRVISCICPHFSQNGRGYVFFHADRRRPDPVPVETALYRALDGLSMLEPTPGLGGGRAAFLDERGETRSGLRKWRLATAASDRSGRPPHPAEVETYMSQLARRLRASSTESAPSGVGRSVGGERNLSSRDEADF